MPEDIPIKPLRFLMCNLCEKYDLVNVIDALLLACQEQQQIIISRGINDTDINLNRIIYSLEDCVTNAYDLPWR
jgi:hypothetical protein